MRMKRFISPDRLLLTAAIALLPLYVFPPGNPQPSHLLFLLMSLVVWGRHGLPNESLLQLLAGLAVYSFAIELLAGAAAEDMRFLIKSTYFLFNLILVAGVYKVVQQNGVITLKTGILIAATFALISLYLNDVNLREIDDEGRDTATFNNPNQLGFFSVCILSMSYLLYIEKALRFTLLLALVAASTFMAIASLSKAAIIANLAVLLFTLRPRDGGSITKLSRIIIPIAAFSLAVYTMVTGLLQDFAFFERIINIFGEQDSSLAVRGYTVFLEGSALQIFFGLGSPEVYRILGREVHSTFADVWSTYGVPGAILILAIFVRWVATLYRNYGFHSTTVLVAPAILYGITHNGIRFSVFWLLVAGSMAAASRRGAVDG
jgi:hypothetical protein